MLRNDPYAEVVPTSKNGALTLDVELTLLAVVVIGPRVPVVALRTLGLHVPLTVRVAMVHVVMVQAAVMLILGGDATVAIAPRLPDVALRLVGLHDVMVQA